MTKTTGREPHQVVEVPAIDSQGGSDIEGRLSSIESHMKHVATKKEVAELRGDLKQEMTEFRGEIKVEMAEFRGEIKGEMTKFRGEIKGEMAELRGEMKEGSAELRDDLKGDVAELRSEIKDVRIWVLGGVVGALLAGIPTGMYLVVNFLEK